MASRVTAASQKLQGRGSSSPDLLRLKGDTRINFTRGRK